MGKTYTIRGKTLQSCFRRKRPAVFLYTACGVDVESKRLDRDGPEFKMVLQRFKEPAYRVQTVESLLSLEAKDVDDLLSALSMSTRTSIKKGMPEGIWPWVSPRLRDLPHARCVGCAAHAWTQPS